MTGCTGRSLAVSSVLLSLRDLVSSLRSADFQTVWESPVLQFPGIQKYATGSHIITTAPYTSCFLPVAPSHRRAVGSVLEYAGSFVTGTCCETAVHSGCLLRRVFGSEFDERSVPLPWQSGRASPPADSLTHPFVRSSLATFVTAHYAHGKHPFAVRFRGARFTHASLSFAATQRAPPQRRLAGPE